MKPKTQNKKPAFKAPAVKPARKDQGIWLLCFTILLVLIAYLPVFEAGFVNWDDDDYVVKNVTIRSFSNLQEILTSSVQGNYHPLTMLSLAFNYSMSGLKPFSYHFVNLLLHLLNTFLVYRLASKLSNNSNIISFATALLFGIHPLHVESVAWVSERKDVLYGFFFLLGLIRYTDYIKNGLRKDYLITFLWFLCSILSKPAAIIFPVALFTFDFFFKRKFNARIFVEKIPYFLIAALFAYLTLSAQKTVGATDKADVFTIGSRILFGFYGYAMYFIKMILPINLVAFYPLPPINESLPASYFLSPLFFIATVIVSLYYWKKNRIVAFGFSFYLVNLLLVLQFKVIGSAVIADRYTYIPLIGLFFIAGWLLEKAFRKKLSAAYSIIVLTGLVLAPITFIQARTWVSGEALWENVIKKVQSSKAYVIRAEQWNKKGNRDKAMSYYNEALRLNKADHEALNNRGNIYFNLQQDSLALKDYNSALALNPEHVPTLSNKGSLLSRRGEYEEGLRYLNRALELKPDYAPAMKNRGSTLMSLNRHDKAIEDFKNYLYYEPDEVEIYNAIGVCFQNTGEYERSIQPFSDAISQSPLPLYFLNRSISYKVLGKMEEARKDALEARGRGLKLDPDYERILGL